MKFLHMPPFAVDTKMWERQPQERVVLWEPLNWAKMEEGVGDSQSGNGPDLAAQERYSSKWQKNVQDGRRYDIPAGYEVTGNVENPNENGLQAVDPLSGTDPEQLRSLDKQVVLQHPEET